MQNDGSAITLEDKRGFQGISQFPPLRIARESLELSKAESILASMEAKWASSETGLLYGSVYQFGEAELHPIQVYRERVDSSAVPDSIKSNWQALANSELSEASYLFLLKLAKKGSEWRGPRSRPLCGRSLSQFLSFWTTVRANALEPEFVLIPNGNLQAEWYRDDTHFTELEFRPDGKILFGIFNGSSEFEGSAKLDEINPLLMVRNYQYLRWRIKDRAYAINAKKHA